MGTAKQHKLFNDYEGFVDKFKVKKTTEDCYTPEPLYNAVRDWCVHKFGLQDATIVRPFFPGGDYIITDEATDMLRLERERLERERLERERLERERLEREWRLVDDTSGLFRTE